MPDQGPIPDPQRGHLSVIAENAQSARIKQKMLPGTRRQSDSASREHAQRMSVRKQCDVA